jgi:hypothetical protein
MNSMYNPNNSALSRFLATFLIVKNLDRNRLNIPEIRHKKNIKI